MSPRTLHLICNAHLDPVWLWEWEEGAAEALSTFRTAADICEECEGFVFNHNESLLYQWVEQFEPELFARIQKLVRQKQWHILGGWFLQPDCNMPSGESFVRQILIGKQYFKQKFHVAPRTAVNFDPFGHSRGLVQILKKSGFSSYLFCRPDRKELTLPADDFIWEGYDGSDIIAHRAPDHYNSFRGKARRRIEKWLKKNKNRKRGLLLWGIGDHGGGPSRQDLAEIEALKKEMKDWEIRHSIPEKYFDALLQEREHLPRHQGDLNPWAVGCYTSMALVKQKHRLLENMYFLTEKMTAQAALQGLMDYPKVPLREAMEDLLFSQFHDILPGSSIREVEAYALQRMDHGLESLARLRAEAFFSMLRGQRRADEGEFPIFVYNPHPFPDRQTIECEFQPHEPNFSRRTTWLPDLKDSQGRTVLFQQEKESANIALEQRKRLVFEAELKPAQMNRFTCRLRPVKRTRKNSSRERPSLVFRSDTAEVAFDPKSGTMKKYRVNGMDYLRRGSFRFLVCKDSADPWGMLVRSFREVVGSFSLMTAKQCARFAGVSELTLSAMRVIEDGPVRTVVEALLQYNASALCLRYKIPKRGHEIGLEARVFWNEKDRMLKVSIPTVFEDGCCRGQVAYGVEEFGRAGEEQAFQKWLAVISSDRKHALSMINIGTYGFDFLDGELRLSLLRSPAYSGHPVSPDIPIVPQDRFEPRLDQGERVFRFWMNAGYAENRLTRIDREALFKNEAPMALVCFPPGAGQRSLPGVQLSDEAIQITALKMGEREDWLVLRLFEPTGSRRGTRVSIPALDLKFEVSLKAFEVKTMAVDLSTKEIFETDLLEHRISPARS